MMLFINNHPIVFSITVVIIVAIIVNALTENSRTTKDLKNRAAAVAEKERHIASAVMIEDLEVQRQLCAQIAQAANDSHLKNVLHEKELIKRERILEEKERRQTYISKQIKLTDLQKREALLAEKERSIPHLVALGMAESAAKVRSRPYFSGTLVFSALAQKDALANNMRLSSALKENAALSYPLHVETQIAGKDGSYTVTLNSCTCVDYQIHKKPCKHMYRLALELGALLNISDEEKTDFLNKFSQQTAEAKAAIAENARLTSQISRQHANLEKKRNAVQRLMEESNQSFPWLSKLYADYSVLQDETLADELLSKPRPARRAADEVSRLAKEKKQALLKLKALEYQMHYLTTLFPWLEEFQTLSPAAGLAAISLDDEYAINEYETLKSWISPEEYRTLSTAEKYQLVLDRYNRRPKSNWEIGRDFERYVGYTYEARGLAVTYTGATLRFEDMGRDLIVTLGDDTLLVIQCKRYAREKTLHEKHIFQLFGSITLMQTQNPGATVKGLFVCTCALSETAIACAKKLEIEYQEFAATDAYPQIKCNISRSTGEKIYHLPLDQQYDRIVIDQSKGEFYAWTVAEAESAGFRRAFRHVSET